MNAMFRTRLLLACATLLVLAAVIVAAFVLPGGADVSSSWWSLLAFAIVGALFALLASRRRWWVALGFAWLIAAWVEAGQAVWLPESGRARILDLVLGCVGGVVGVACAAGLRVAADARRSARVRRPPALAPRTAGVTAAAEAPRTR